MDFDAVDGEPVDLVFMLLAPESAGADHLKALARVSPLIKGYLRLGGFVGDGAVIDEQFDSTDVFIIVKTELVTEKYMRHYERGAPIRD